ncbi:MAG: MFS transporter [Anaerolineales bacterium]
MFSKASTGFWVLVATILGSCMSYIDSTVIYIALPVLQNDLNATVVQAQWIVEAYVLFQAALILVGGSLGDRIGRRRVFAAGIVVFALASALCGFATSPNFLIVARILQALGGAMLGPASLAIITAFFDEKRRPAAFGAWSGASAIALALGPAAGAFIVQNASWRWLFFINIPIAALTLLVLFWKVPESKNEEAASRLDWRGAALATLGLGSFVFGFIESANYGFQSPIVWGSIIFGMITFGLFLQTQRTTKEPLLPLSLFRSSTFSGANLFTLLLYGAMNALIFFLPFNLIQIQQYDIVQAALGFLPFPLIIGFASGFSGRLIARYGVKRPLIAGPIIVAVGFILFGRAGLGASFWLDFLPAVIVMAIGLSIIIAPLTTAVMGSVPPRLSGTASGINTAINSTANVLAVAVLGVVALSVFNISVDRQLHDVDLPPQSIEQIETETVKLANAQAPKDLPPTQQDQVNRVFDLAFIDAFRVLMYVCALLVLMGAAVSWFMISGSPPTEVSTGARLGVP